MTTKTTPPAAAPAATSAPAVTKPAAAPVVAETKPEPVQPAYALHRVNGTIEPGTPFRPATQRDRDELLELEAIRDLTDDEAALFEKLEQAEQPEPAAEDALG